MRASGNLLGSMGDLRETCEGSQLKTCAGCLSHQKGGGSLVFDILILAQELGAGAASSLDLRSGVDDSSQAPLRKEL